MQSIALIVDTCSDYLSNSLEPIPTKHEASLRSMLNNIEQYLSELATMMKRPDLPELINQKRVIFAQLKDKLSQQIEGIKQSKNGLRESMLIFRIVLESKDLIAIAARFSKL